MAQTITLNLVNLVKLQVPSSDEDETSLVEEVVVCPSAIPGKYFVLTGHKALALAQATGMTNIKVTVTETGGIFNQVSKQALLSMSPLDRAALFLNINKFEGMMGKDIAKHFGISPAEVSLTMRLAGAHPKLLDALQNEVISSSAIEPLLGLSLEEQDQLADAVIQAKTVSRVTDLVRTYKTKRALGDQAVTEVEDGPDPLQVMVAEELEEGLSHLRNVQLSEITHPELRRKVRPTVEELLTIAATLEAYTDEVRPDLQDLAP